MKLTNKLSYIRMRSIPKFKRKTSLLSLFSFRDIGLKEAGKWKEKPPDWEQ